MIFRVGIENNNEGIRSIAWALNHPGCFAYGKDADEALANLPEAIRAYSAWLAEHGATWMEDDNVELKLEEQFTCYNINESLERDERSDFYTVESWFQHDWKPLASADIEHALKLLTWSREDLINTVKGLSDEKLEQKYPNERWSINGILNHVGGAEWWYIERLGLAFPREDLPKHPMARLEKVRAHLNEILPTLEGSKQVVGVDGEFWSPRKMLRRAIWHEKDHTEHIGKLTRR